MSKSARSGVVESSGSSRPCFGSTLFERVGEVDVRGLGLEVTGLDVLSEELNVLGDDVLVVLEVLRGEFVKGRDGVLSGFAFPDVGQIVDGLLAVLQLFRESLVLGLQVARDLGICTR